MIISISRVWFEHHNPGDALGIATVRPRISWRFEGDANDWIQATYEIEVRRFPAEKEKSQQDASAQTFRVESSDSCLVPWPGADLQPREVAFLRVRVRGTSESEFTAWSDEATVEASIPATTSEGWANASLIESPLDQKANPETGHRPIIFSRRFTIPSTVQRARLYITAHGIYQARINGNKVGDHVFPPGWTSYNHRLLYQTYDVSKYLHSSGVENTIEVLVGEGWWAGNLGFFGTNRDVWGDCLGLFARLAVFTSEGTTFDLVTDESWQSKFGPILSSEFYNGETFDSSFDISGAEAKVTSVVSKDMDTTKLAAPTGPPVRTQEEVKIRTVTKRDDGTYILDFGQNLVGWLRVKVTGPSGHEVVFKHSEVLEDGQAAMRPLRSAKSTDRVILCDQEITWEPSFTYHGFRYVQVEGWPGELSHDAIVAVVIHTDMERTGWFECSNTKLNQLHENIVWSTRGNFVSVPTDCPQRNERLGWTGDIQVFAPTANFLYDTSGMLQSWLTDVANEQEKTGTGAIGLFIPSCFRFMPHKPMAVWGDAAVTVPWDLYQASGDLEILQKQFQSMRNWIEEGIPKEESDGLLWSTSTEEQLGDWLDPSAPPAEPGNGRTNSVLVADAYLVMVTDRMVKTCAALGRNEDEQRYRDLASRRRAAFADKYITARGGVVSDSQTATALVLAFSLAPTLEIETVVAARLEHLIRAQSHFRIGTGFVGTSLLGPALSSVGRDQVFYRMLLCTKNPSWLYPVKMGATTMWERWDSMLEDGSINPGEMTSFNHYALGSVGGWMHSYMVGMTPLEPGWKKMRVQPRPGGGLKFAE